MTNTMIIYIHLSKEWEEKQEGGEFTKEKKFTGDKRKNYWEEFYRSFRMWLLLSKLILFEKVLLIFHSFNNLEILFVFSLYNKEIFSVSIFWYYVVLEHKCILRCWEMQPVLDRWSVKRLSRIVVVRSVEAIILLEKNSSSGHLNHKTHDVKWIIRGFEQVPNKISRSENIISISQNW